MEFSFGKIVLSVFDVWDDARDLLRDIIESGIAPHGEMQWLLRQSLLAADEDWHYLIHCARSIRQFHCPDLYGLEGADVLTYVCHILEGFESSDAQPPEDWQNTDRLILLAKELAKDPIIKPPSFPTHNAGDGGVVSELPPAKTRLATRATSHFWSDATATEGSTEQSNPTAVTSTSRHRQGADVGEVRLDNAKSPKSHNPTLIQHLQTCNSTGCTHSNHCGNSVESRQCVRPQKLVLSPYFSTSSPTAVRASPKRPPAGTVSCVPFPPLSAPYFGIVQERLAHEPLWLLIAVTFLIKTKGRLAIPVFYEVKKRFPTPSHLADPANAQELSDMIRHLGLAVVRVVYIQKFAKAFLDQPPRPGVRYRVRNYDRRDVEPPRSCPGGSPDDSDRGLQMFGNYDGDPEAWEIGHMTQGKYAIDSWRIFCRDELLGRAEDWNGKGREPEFQPEWMRVLPQDKELRAYLRWMWMREGWEWDPVSGERTVLREEMRRAVDEGRVEYDDTGGLAILDEPRMG